MNYFQPYETECRCGCGEDITDEFRSHLNDLRILYGYPMKVNSGRRCEAHNASVGGSPRSRHKAGTAADIKITDPRKAHQFVITAMKLGFSVGIYSWGCHIDRGRPQPILFRGPN